MKAVILRRPDGRVTVRIPNMDAPENIIEDETEDERFERLCAINENRGGRIRVGTAVTEDFPLGHEHFKDARGWDDVAERLVVDMSKARVIKTDRVRLERDNRLAVDDIAYMRADEAGDGTLKRDIAARKQSLRTLPADIQPDLDAIDDPEVLDRWQPPWPS